MGRRKSSKGTRRKGKKRIVDENSRSLDSFVEKSPDNSLNEGMESSVSADAVIEDSLNESDIEAEKEIKTRSQSPGKLELATKKKPQGKEKTKKSPGRPSNISLIERSERRKNQNNVLTGDVEVKSRVPPPEITSGKIEASDITAPDARSFLNEFRSCVTEKLEVGLYFHNDMDGLNGAIMIYSMLLDWEVDGLKVHIWPLEYTEVPKLKIDEDICYIFVDMDINLSGENIFRIDHHAESRDEKRIEKRLFLLSPPEKDYEYPSSSTALCGYLNFISSGGRMSFLNFLKKGSWHQDPFYRLLILLASVCDNLWHLNFLIDIPIKRWIPDPEEEKYLILISISASILLGDDEKRAELVERFFKKGVTPDEYLEGLCSCITGANNILLFAEKVSSESEIFYNKIFFNITDSIDKTLYEVEKDKKVLKELENSMPIDMRGNREKMMELLKTKGDPNDEHWKRIEFYGKEMERLENKLKIAERKLTRLRAAKKMFSSESGPRLCVVLPRQGSKQVKGIIASLLYYKGWKNIVIEERGSEAAWGARGFSRKVIDGYFSNLSMGYDELKDYLLLEKVYKELPDVFRKTINISKNISFYKTYEGGMGGRGLIYGGSLMGRVPWMFSLLEESGDMEEKVKELMKHKELGNALQGLTEGQSTVSTAQALRAKFKSTGWLVTSLIPGKEGADILLGNFKQGILHLVGYNERIGFDLDEQEPTIHMDHGRFDVAD
jgi:hypothetical protein